jgi:hypothetical protein
MALAENHRCSQKICDAAAHFCTRTEADIAVGPDRDCQIDPEVALYPAATPEQALVTFRARLTVHDIEPRAAAVLARGHAMVGALGGETSKVDIQERPERVARIAVALAQGTLTRADVRYAEQCVARCTYGDEISLEDLEDEDRRKVRVAAYTFLSGLPAVEGDLRAWIRSVKEALQASACLLVEKPATGAGMLIKSGSHHEGVAAEQIFTPPSRDLTPRTVHSIKGEDRDAVMMVVRKPHGADPTRQLDLFQAVASGAEVAEGSEEERRVTFVALTRARRYCMVALPDTTRGRDVAAACRDLGFVSV